MSRKKPGSRIAQSNNRGDPDGYRPLPGLYVHVPFCRKKCLYCNFYSVSGSFNPALYCRTIRQQAGWFAGLKDAVGLVFGSVFFGGGTPTLLPAHELASLLRSFYQTFFISSSAEITIEANPATVGLKDFQILRQAGFNRLSLGVQSFQDDELARIGRLHSAEDAQLAVQEARQAGFDNISLDLMYGLPGQSIESWQESLQQAVALKPQHLSIYELTIEDDTVFGKLSASGSLCLPSEDEVLAMMDLQYRLTRRAGLYRYEISNYAKQPYRCAHNLNYWHNGTYVGLGPGAVSYLNGKRLHTGEDLEKWYARIASGKPFWRSEEKLDRESCFRETVIMGLRILQGVSIASLKERFSIDATVYYYDEIARLSKQGLFVVERDYIRLSDRALPIANKVLSELV